MVGIMPRCSPTWKEQSRRTTKGQSTLAMMAFSARTYLNWFFRRMSAFFSTCARATPGSAPAMLGSAPAARPPGSAATGCARARENRMPAGLSTRAREFTGCTRARACASVCERVQSGRPPAALHKGIAKED